MKPAIATFFSEQNKQQKKEKGTQNSGMAMGDPFENI